MFPSNQTVNINGVNYTGFSCTPPTGPFSSPFFGPCPVIGVDPNFKQPFSAQWNLDVQRAITSKLTLDVAYVGNHGYREEFSTDLNQPALGAGYNQATINNCLAADRCTTNANRAGLKLGSTPPRFRTLTI